MKTLKSFFEYLRSNPMYLGLFENQKDVFNSFNENEDPDVIICYADYTDEDYSGNAAVLFYKKSTDKYYEVYGSHCSCYGLEDQWGEEEIVFEELEKRVTDLRYFDKAFKKAFKEYQVS